MHMQFVLLPECLGCFIGLELRHCWSSVSPTKIVCTLCVLNLNLNIQCDIQIKLHLKVFQVPRISEFILYLRI